MDYWIKESEEKVDSDIYILGIIANKIDLDINNQNIIKEGESFAKSKEAKFLSFSAKTDPTKKLDIFLCELVQEFLTTFFISECNYSMNTKTSYSTTFHLLLEFMDEKKNIKPNKIEIETITKEVIVQFLDWLETNRFVSISTRNQRLACIKSFCKYVQSNEPDLFDNCVLILSIKNKKVPNKMISYFTEDEIKIMINYLNNSKDLKKLTMICVLYETGARVSELQILS